MQEIIKQNVAVLTVAEAKIDALFPSAQFYLERYLNPYRLDIFHISNGLLVYVKAIILSRQLSLTKFQFRKQALPFELNLRKKMFSNINIYVAVNQVGKCNKIGNYAYFPTVMYNF